MSDALGPDAKRLVRAARARLPTDEDRERSRRAILKGVAAAAAAATVTGASSAAAASNGSVAGAASAFAGVTGAIKLGAILGVVAVAGAAGVSTRRSPAPAPGASTMLPVAPASSLRPPPRVERGKPEPKAEVVAPPPPAHPSASASFSSARRAEDGSALAAEVEVLRAARKALDEGNPAESARILEQSGATIGEGALSSERRGALLIARCRGDVPASSLAGELDGFLRDYPSSPLAPRVGAECARVASQRDGGDW